MSEISASTPPSYEVLTEQDGKAKLAWQLWFERIAKGDPGTSFTPNIVNMTTVGTPQITGAYYQNQGFTDFWVNIIPATSISGTAGTTYIELPFLVTIDAACFAVSGLQSFSGAVDSASRRAYPPSFSAVTVPMTITGRVVSQ